jgi:hypothetical protein
VLAALLGPGNAGANDAADHVHLLELALAQLPQAALDGAILARADSAGASHLFADACRETRVRFSLGYGLTEPVRGAIVALPDTAWTPALNADGQPRDGAWVAELTDTVDLDAWPTGTRLMCRRERPHPGAQLSFTDHDGYHFQCFITDQTDTDLAWPGWRLVIASTPSSRTASAASKRWASQTCLSAIGSPTPHGLRSR